jgi:protein-disulfide isomerase
MRPPRHATPEGDGLLVGDGPVLIDAYIDFICPYCRLFEERCGPLIDRLLAGHLASVAYHPLNFLDRLSTTAYSSRAASASGCASDRDSFLVYAKALFAVQPPEGGPGLMDEELAEVGAHAGIDDPGFAACVSDHVYVPWVAQVSERAMARGVSGTPTVYVDGMPVAPDPSAIATAVSQQLPAGARRNTVG